MLTGGCRCGHVRYETASEPRSGALCYCEDCRRAAGAPVVGWFSVPEASLRFTNAPKRVRSSEGVERGFCPECGTQILFHEHGDAGIDLTICSLDEPDRVKPRDHIWTRSKPAWFAIGDDLPRHEKGRDGS
jgi:hypothetical protein